MKLSAILAAAVVVVGLLATPSSAWAQARYDEEPPAERFSVALGGFLVSNFNTTFRLDSKVIPFGTVIDLEDTLRVDSNERVVRLDGFYRFNKKHRFAFGWFSSNRTGLTTVQEDIKLVDPETDEEITIEAGASVESTWDFDVFNFLYHYSFLNTWRYELYIGGGFNARNLKIDLKANFNVNDIGDREQVEASGLIPLPVISFGGRWNFSRKWLVHWRQQWFAIEFGEFRGKITDTLVTFDNNTFKHVGFGFGLNSYDLQVDAEGEKLRGELDSGYLGFLFYVKGYF